MPRFEAPGAGDTPPLGIGVNRGDEPDETLIGTFRLPANDGEGLADTELIPLLIAGLADGTLGRGVANDGPKVRGPLLDEGRYDFMLPNEGVGELD